ncbi:MAG: cell division protein ZapA [Novosphingobium sp.]|nr:cell division protein ZapA [Novosphingobium sp.]
MSNVTLRIGGRSYTVACAEGEEQHVAMLGRLIDEKVATMGTAGGQNEVRSLLFASLLLADELHDARQAKGQAPAVPAAEPVPELAPALERIAQRIENLAGRFDNA